MPDAAMTPTTGIIEPVMTPISWLKPYLTQPSAVSGLGSSSSVSSTAAAPPPPMRATIAL